MASEHDSRQQLQAQLPHQDDGDKSGGQDTSTTITTSSSAGHVGHHEDDDRGSQNNHASMSIDDETTTGTDFITFDGIKFNISDFDGKEGNHGPYNVQDFYHDGVFSCEDIYAVVDPSNTTSVVTEIENPSDWHSGSYISAGNSDLKQLGFNPNDSHGSVTPAVLTGTTKDNDSTSLAVGGMKIPASGGYPSNGSFYRLVTLTNSLNSVSAEESNGVTSASSGSTTANSSMENSQSSETMASPAAGTKARKPRGRKPKHVKEAEAAAAASTCSVQSPAETATSSPNGTVVQSTSRRARCENPNDMALKNVIQKAFPPSSSSAQQQNGTTPPPNSPFIPQQHVNASTGNAVVANMQQWSQPQMSLEQLASHDRRAILMAMRNQSMSVAEKSYHHHYSQQQQQQLASQNKQPPPTAEANREYPHPQHQHRPLHSEQTASPTPYERSTQPARASQQRAKDPLDQLFASRISAPSHRSTVKPNIIQENRRIYNLLTTPTRKGCTPTSLEHLKLSQERWMQYPNPSILNENPTDTSGAQQAATASGVHLSSYPPPPPPPRADPATFIPCGEERGNIHRGSDFNSGVSHPYRHEYGSGYHRYTNQIQEMNERVERLAEGNHKLRRQLEYLMKVNRHLMNRLRVEIEENMDLREIKYQQSLELNGDSEVGSTGRRDRGLSAGGILSSYVEEELIGRRGNSFGRRRYMRYEDNEEDTLGDNPSWLLGGISGGLNSYRRHFPLHKRSSLLRREHGPLEREVMGEGYFGDEGKRKLDTFGSSSQYGDLRKRICPDNLEITVTDGERKLNEMGKSLGEDNINPRDGESENFSAASQPASLIIEEMDISRVKQELSSPVRTSCTDRGSLNSVKSVATELVTPATTDDSENTNSTVFNSPVKPANFVHSTGPYFEAYDFESFHSSGGLKDAIVVEPSKMAVSTGNIEKIQDNE